MEKPKNYDNVQPFGEYEPLEIGGHICKIMKVEEIKSRTGRDMLEIYLDIAEGRQKNYYTKQWNDDKRDNKKWGCIVYQIVTDNNSNASRGLKTFNICVEKSNTDFKLVWGNDYAKNFKGKLIGGVFGREQYRRFDGSLGFVVRCQSFRSVEAIKNGIEPPKDKLLEDTLLEDTAQDNEFYTVVKNIDDNDLPF